MSTFKRELLNYCQRYFLENQVVGSLELLRAPNFLIQQPGGRMVPTTIDAANAYFEWFRYESRDTEPDCVLNSLATLRNAGSNGSERGHAFERYLSSKLTLCGRDTRFRLTYRLLRESYSLSMEMAVNHRLHAKADSPPNDFRNFPPRTLLTHTGRDGGQARVDMIYYGSNDVVYMEATVGNYRSTKLPCGEGGGERVELILGALKKWLGQNVYDVEINDDSTEVIATYSKSYTSRSGMDQKTPPNLYYMVVTTCPSSLQPTSSRAKKYKWIKMCFLEDLIRSGIISSVNAEAILNGQADDAKNSSFLEWLKFKFIDKLI